jgi:hypothetical protein
MEKRYENYPAWMIIVCNLVPVSIYVIGAVILSGFSIWVSVAYLLFCLWAEVRVMRTSCINCFYYGKNCGTGKGRLCKLLFKQGNPQRFAAKEATWIELLPDLLISLIPLVSGIILSFMDFSWLRLILMAILVALASAGTGAIRGNLLCKYCEQGRIGCPALKLFEKSTKETSS